MQSWQAVATVAIGALALVIALGQWLTARSKLVLDLFEHRLKIYSDLRKPIAHVMTHASSDMENLIEFDRACDRAEFLFGKEVVDYLARLRKALIDLAMAEEMLKANNLPGDQRSQYVDHKHRNFRFICEFYEEFPRLIAPYVRMDQKLVVVGDYLRTIVGKVRRAK